VNPHVPTQTAFKPYVGIGLNYTTHFEETTSVAAVTELNESFGLALQAGLDCAISQNGSLRHNVRCIDIDSDLTLDGTRAGTVEIDPWFVGIGYGHKF
jgi:outer membrane protein